MTITKEELQKRMLANVSDDYDKTEGSFFYDSISPVAIELKDSYKDQSEILNNAFVGTASGDYLDRKCSEIGIIRKPATKATGQVEITGTVGANILLGSLVSTELVIFVIVENKTIGATGKELVNVECQQYGVVGNVPSSSIKYFPVTLEGITAVNNQMTFSDGYDAETDASLKLRYYEKINTPATSGNVYHYKQWAKEVEDVGDAKVFSTWNGPGTVKVVICDRNKRAATNELINTTKMHIDENRPIGATVTVTSAAEKTINITATITLGNGRTLEQIKTDFSTALTDYFKQVAFVDSYISYAKIGNILFDIYGVADYSLLKVNTGIVNITLLETEIPVLGTVVLS